MTTGTAIMKNYFKIPVSLFHQVEFSLQVIKIGTLYRYRWRALF